ncbi:MAG: M20/M25/M40 family metallo-hydrolase, partial [Pseudomonadota bacterium]|nr:M20/M25/M40 family metallo-hydrolase [Pseudomonadota bacterium]
MRQAGYEVRFEEFTFPFFEERSPPQLLSGAAQTATPREALRTLAYSGAGDVTGRLGAVDLGLTDVAPPAPSTSGCEASDFAGFEPGAIALVRRGTCPFQTKVENAVSAGAIGVIVMNEGTSERTGSFSGRLAKAATVPVVAVSYEFGRSLERTAAAEDGSPIRLAVDVQTGTRATRNVVAETRAGDPSRMIVVGAHLDSVSDGPGINDNGSGSAAVLEAALSLAERPTQPRNRIRFAFWGAEEQGLFGSRHHANALSEEERRRTVLYINLDMVGSPNYGRFIHGPGQEPASGPAAVALGAMLEFFQQRRLPVEVRDPGPRRHSDDASFVEKGIPSVGLYTGAG